MGIDLDSALQELKDKTVEFIRQAVESYGNPCYVEYQNFYLKNLGLSGLGGRLVSVKDGHVILGNNEDVLGDITDDLEYLSVIATAIADPANVSHEERNPREK